MPSLKSNKLHTSAEYTALTLQLPPNLKFTDEEFEQIVAVNQELRLELTAVGELVIIAPTGGETGNRNFDLLGQLWFWNSQKNLGIVMVNRELSLQRQLY
ncbi:Uma2 family endonuclease [Scytonema hofmannii]|uniref:Uma2 family endonuclease n=1 Tax=Scytonema hofmannii TaxID=34078 RepID=UPI00234E85CD|nr:Uma2 family endonuclease [Scytonema hofmannii]